MHADGKSTLASVSKWNSGKVNICETVILVSLSLSLSEAQDYCEKKKRFFLHNALQEMHFEFQKHAAF